MKRKILVILLALALVGLGVVFWPNNSCRRVLPDGTVLVLSGVKVGQANVYTHGSGLAKILGRIVPTNGVGVGRFQLQPSYSLLFPSYGGHEFLGAELQMIALPRPQPNALLSPPFYRKQRLLISGDTDDFVFVMDLDGFKKLVDGTFARIWAGAFPRDSRQLHFRLEERDRSDTRDWHELTTFVVRNPRPARVEDWKPETASRFALPEGLELELGELVVRHEPMHPTDIWEYRATLPARVLRNGQAVTNWGLLETTMQDASGNVDSLPANKLMTNGWDMYRAFRPLDPAKLWRFKSSVGCDSDFPATNLVSFTVPFPLPGPVLTNLGGFPCRIEFVNTVLLSVQLTNQPPGVRVTFVRATDEEGHDLADFSGSWGQHAFWKSLKLRGPQPAPKQIQVTVAIRPEYEVTFTLRPRDETKIKR